MSKFSKGQWKVTYNGYLMSGEKLIGEVYDVSRFSLTSDDHAEADSNARLIAAAPEMYARLKEELVPTSDYGGILSFSREAKIRELLARIDGTEANNE